MFLIQPVLGFIKGVHKALVIYHDSFGGVGTAQSLIIRTFYCVFVGLLLPLPIWFFLVGWPVSGHAFVFLLACFTSFFLREQLRLRYGEHTITGGILSNFENLFAWLAFGALITISWAILLSIVREETIAASVDYFIVRVDAFLSEGGLRKGLFWAAIAAAVLCIFIPNERWMSTVSKTKKWIGRAAAILLSLMSFSVFSMEKISHDSSKVVSGVIGQRIEIQRRIEQTNREILSIAWVSLKLENLRSTEHGELYLLMYAASKSNYVSEIADFLGESWAQSKRCARVV